tara:strand:- start:1553 stop:2026 length:474 start_codon:yes stop_codon:yes gene_type:complete
MQKLLVILMLVMPIISFAETVKLVDGRTLKLNPDGTYIFVDGKSEILIKISECQDYQHSSTREDDWGNVKEYINWSGFSFTYEITNGTPYPIRIESIGASYRRNSSFNERVITPFLWSGQTSPGQTYYQESDGFTFFTESKTELSKDQLEALRTEYG